MLSHKNKMILLILAVIFLQPVCAVSSPRSCFLFQREDLF